MHTIEAFLSDHKRFQLFWRQSRLSPNDLYHVLGTLVSHGLDYVSHCYRTEGIDMEKLSRIPPPSLQMKRYGDAGCTSSPNNDPKLLQYIAHVHGSEVLQCMRSAYREIAKRKTKAEEAIAVYQSIDIKLQAATLSKMSYPITTFEQLCCNYLRRMMKKARIERKGLECRRSKVPLHKARGLQAIKNISLCAKEKVDRHRLHAKIDTNDEMEAVIHHSNKEKTGSLALKIASIYTRNPLMEKLAALYPSDVAQADDNNCVRDHLQANLYGKNKFEYIESQNGSLKQGQKRREYTNWLGEHGAPHTQSLQAHWVYPDDLWSPESSNSGSSHNDASTMSVCSIRKQS